MAYLPASVLKTIPIIVISFINSFIHSGHFYSASSSPLLLRNAPDTARILCRSFMPKCHRKLCVKDLPKVPTWRLERESAESYRLNQCATMSHDLEINKFRNIIKLCSRQRHWQLGSMMKLHLTLNCVSAIRILLHHEIHY